MPTAVKKIKGKYRVVEKNTGRILKTKKGNARDGGGHKSRAKAESQSAHIDGRKKNAKR